MKQMTILASLTAAISVCASATEPQITSPMEKCIINKNGQSLIKAHKSDCATSHYSCSGQNPANDPEAWIFVPKGECVKINAGNYSGIDTETKAKITTPSS